MTKAEMRIDAINSALDLLNEVQCPKSTIDGLKEIKDFFSNQVNKTAEKKALAGKVNDDIHKRVVDFLKSMTEPVTASVISTAVGVSPQKLVAIFKKYPDIKIIEPEKKKAPNLYALN